MDNVVYWSKKDNFWHLYKDCPDFKTIPILQKKGTAEKAVADGCVCLCPTCRLRYEEEHPEIVSNSAPADVETTVPAEQPAAPSSGVKLNSWQRHLVSAAAGALAMLILASAFYSSRMEKDIESARQDGYTSGYSEGTSDGYGSGYDAGYTVGYSEGTDSGYETGFFEGSDSGYQTGFSEGSESGRTEGYEQGSAEGYDKGYDEGYAEGKKDAAAVSAASSASGNSSGSSSGTGSSGGSSGTSTADTQENSVTVYITATGSKYHRSGCSYLKKSSIPISLSSAKAQGYTPCSRCNPPA